MPFRGGIYHSFAYTAYPVRFYPQWFISIHKYCGKEAPALNTGPRQCLCPALQPPLQHSLFHVYRTGFYEYSHDEAEPHCTEASWRTPRSCLACSNRGIQHRVPCYLKFRPTSQRINTSAALRSTPCRQAYDALYLTAHRSLHKTMQKFLTPPTELTALQLHCPEDL